MTDIRPLRPDDLPAAARLVDGTLHQIPLYQAMLGQYTERADIRDWLCRALIRGSIAGGTAVGAFADDRLVGVLTWSIGDRPAPAPEPDQLAADARFLAGLPDLARRLQRAWDDEHTLLTHPDPTAVAVQIAAVDPEHRRGGTLYALVEPVEELCRTQGRPYTCWTGSDDLRQGFSSARTVVDSRTVTVCGVPMHFLEFDVAALGG